MGEAAYACQACQGGSPPEANTDPSCWEVLRRRQRWLEGQAAPSPQFVIPASAMGGAYIEGAAHTASSAVMSTNNNNALGASSNALGGRSVRFTPYVSQAGIPSSGVLLAHNPRLDTPAGLFAPQNPVLEPAGGPPGPMPRLSGLAHTELAPDDWPQVRRRFQDTLREQQMVQIVQLQGRRARLLEEARLAEDD